MAKILLNQDQVLEILDTLIHKMQAEREIYARKDVFYTIPLNQFADQLTNTMTSVFITTVDDSAVVVIQGSRQ